MRLAIKSVPGCTNAVGSDGPTVLILALRAGMPQPPEVIEPLSQVLPDGPAAGVVLQVRFRDDIALSTLRASLRAVDAEVIGGPSALGIWRIRVPSEAEERSLRALAADPAVLQVQPEP